MRPRLEAEEALERINIIGAGSVRVTPDSRRALVNAYKRQAGSGRVRTRQASPAALGVMGIGLTTVKADA